MIPYRFDFKIWRGASFNHELVSQVKSWIYNPDVHNATPDLKRTHAENLEEYGFDWVYVDFLSDYTAAELVIKRPFVNGQQPKEPIMTLSLAAGDIELTTRSVKFGISSAAATLDLDWDKGTYELKLTTAAGEVDCLVYGEIEVLGDRAA